ncbi:MAG: HAD domain-containing protein [Nannocystaceae bacterium]|nr:HAD domain-containing protein [bacterium]
MAARLGPAEGFHWAYTDRREKRHRRAEIVYVHWRDDGELEVHAFDRSLPLAADELHAWGPAVPPGPTTGALATIERFAPVRRQEDDPSAPTSIPHSLHMQAHAAWVGSLETPRSAHDVARCGGFTPAELDEHAPGWRDWQDFDWRRRQEPESPSPAPPVLFLDIDGVLNVVGAADTERAVAQLRRVVSTTGCHIVLSSAWRLFKRPFKAIRERFGFAGPFIGCTPDLKGQPRGLEIAAWLAGAPNPPSRWAVVDDEGDMDFVRHRFVQTNPRVGLGETEADQLIAMLTGAEGVHA